MTFGAGFFVSEEVILTHGVLAGRHYLEMDRIAAGTVAAEVVELHSLRDLLVVLVLPENAMHYPVWLAWPFTVFAVTVWGFGAGPYPAVVFDADLAFDACEFAGVQSPVLHATRIQEWT